MRFIRIYKVIFLKNNAIVFIVRAVSIRNLFLNYRERERERAETFITNDVCLFKHVNCSFVGATNVVII